MTSLQFLIHPVYAYIEVDRKRSIHPEISLERSWRARSECCPFLSAVLVYLLF